MSSSIFNELNNLIPGVSGVFSALSGFATVWIILGSCGALLLYVFTCYTWMCIGRKAGLKTDWMAYVPFVQDFYQLKIVRAPGWHVIFFGSTGLLCIGAVELLLGAITLRSLLSDGMGFWAVLMLILFITWFVFAIYVLFKFRFEYYKQFHFNPMLALGVFLGVAYSMVLLTIDVLIAYKTDIRYGAQQPANAPVRPPVPAAPNPNPNPNLNPNNGVASILGLSGMYKDATFEIRGMEAINIGRDGSECQIVLDQFNSDISRKHCTICFNPSMNQFVVTDFSKNGTFTSDGRRLQQKIPATLPRGTTIYLGNQNNMFRLN